MKAETQIYDIIKHIIPENSSENVFFAAISKNSYEVLFYSYINGEPIQCFTLAEQNILDENELDTVFEGMANVIKGSKEYDENKLNIATVKTDSTGITMKVEHYEKNARLYELKKDWTRSLLSKNA